MDREKRTVYISMHQNNVREGIRYTDRRTGEEKEFNKVTLPAGTIIRGEDLGGWEFSPLFVNPAKYRGPQWRDIPLLADREVWLSRTLVDPEGNPILDEDGKFERETRKVMPSEIKEALTAARKSWSRQNEARRGLSERAASADGCSRRMEGPDQGPTRGTDGRWDHEAQ